MEKFASVHPCYHLQKLKYTSGKINATKLSNVCFLKNMTAMSLTCHQNLNKKSLKVYVCKSFIKKSCLILQLVAYLTYSQNLFYLQNYLFTKKKYRYRSNGKNKKIKTFAIFTTSVFIV